MGEIFLAEYNHTWKMMPQKPFKGGLIVNQTLTSRECPLPKKEDNQCKLIGINEECLVWKGLIK